MTHNSANHKHSTYQSWVFHNIVGVRRILLVFLRVSIYLHGLYRPLLTEKALLLTWCTREMFSSVGDKQNWPNKSPHEHVSEEHFVLTTKKILCGNKKHNITTLSISSQGFRWLYILPAYIVWLPPESMMRSCTHWIAWLIPRTGHTRFFDRSSPVLPMSTRLICLANPSFPWSCPEPALQHLSGLTVNSPARRCKLIKSHWGRSSLKTKTSQRCWNEYLNINQPSGTMFVF